MNSNYVLLPIAIVRTINGRTVDSDETIELFVNKLVVVAVGVSGQVKGGSIIFVSSRVDSDKEALHVRLPYNKVIEKLAFGIADAVLPEMP